MALLVDNKNSEDLRTVTPVPLPSAIQQVKHDPTEQRKSRRKICTPETETANLVSMRVHSSRELLDIFLDWRSLASQILVHRHIHRHDPIE